MIARATTGSPPPTAADVNKARWLAKLIIDGPSDQHLHLLARVAHSLEGGRFRDVLVRVQKKLPEQRLHMMAMLIATAPAAAFDTQEHDGARAAHAEAAGARLAQRDAPLQPARRKTERGVGQTNCRKGQ